MTTKKKQKRQGKKYKNIHFFIEKISHKHIKKFVKEQLP